MPTRSPPKNTHRETEAKRSSLTHTFTEAQCWSPSARQKLRNQKVVSFFFSPPSSLSLSLSHSLTLPPSLSCVRLQGCYAETGILTDSTLRSQHFIILAVRGCGAQRGREKEKWGMNSCSSVIQLKLRAVRQKEKGWHLVVWIVLYLGNETPHSETLCTLCCFLLKWFYFFNQSYLSFILLCKQALCDAFYARVVLFHGNQVCYHDHFCIITARCSCFTLTYCHQGLFTFRLILLNWCFTGCCKLAVISCISGILL